MKKWVSMMMVLGLMSFVAMGCGGEKDKPAADAPAADSSATDGSPPVTPTSLVADGYKDKKVCGSCGTAFSAGDSHDCEAGEHSHCDCGFHKGSALCCQSLPSADAEGKAYCGNCGQEAGTENCCKADGAKCEKCGFHAGSALCCKIKPKA